MVMKGHLRKWSGDSSVLTIEWEAIWLDDQGNDLGLATNLSVMANLALYWDVYVTSIPQSITV
jgi:hypothetical protein